MTPQEKRYEYQMVAIMFGIWGIVFLDRTSLLYLAPYVAPDLKLTGPKIGELGAAIGISWAISSFVFGIISDRVGRRKILIPMIIIFSLTSFLSGLANNFWEIMVARTLMGIAEGPCWTIVNAIVERGSSPGTRARNVGMVVSAAALVGLALSPILTTQIAAHFGWRTAFFVAGTPGLILGGLAYWFVKEPEKTIDADALDHQLRISDIPALLKNHNILLCCLGTSGFIGWLILQNTFGPLFITLAMHKPGTEAGFLLGAAGIGSFVLGFIGPAFSNRFGKRNVLLFFACLSFPLPLVLLCHPLYEFPWLLAAILFCMQGGQAITTFVIVLIPASSVPSRFAASSIGLVTMIGEIIGGVLTPLVAGKLTPEFGYALPLEMAAGSMGLVILAAALIKETVSRNA